MFDTSLMGPASLADADDGALVATIAGWARMEAAAAAHRLAAIGELVARRTRGAEIDRSRWACDNWDSAAAEVAAAEQISHAMASSQMYLASALRDRIPRVAALFLAGRINARLASAIAWHTTVITDPGVLMLVDADLAALATSLGPLSVPKTAAAIDALIERHDPAAVRRMRDRARGRDLVVDTNQTEGGTTAVWGRLFAVDAAALDQRLAQLARSVCDDDPRTLAQRRADALGALAAGAESLACACNHSDCTAVGAADARAAGVVVYVVADPAAVDAASDPQLSGEPDTALPGSQPKPAPSRVPSGRIIGGGSVPPGLLAELVAGGATVKPLRMRAESAAEPRYRPSAALAAVIRARDMSCRFPGCDRPATVCDIDHAIPFPWGPTHPSNLRCLCRKHHLLKTFWTGADGWTDRQHPDGTIDWTSPTGHIYTTRPGSRLLFPSLCLPTIAPPGSNPTAPPTARQRGIMMPARQTTRAQDRIRCIRTERAFNLAQRDKPPP